MQDTFLIGDAISSLEKVANPGARPSLIHTYERGTGNPAPFIRRQQLLVRLGVPRETLHWRIAQRFRAIATISIICRGIDHERA